MQSLLRRYVRWLITPDIVLNFEFGNKLVVFQHTRGWFEWRVTLTTPPPRPNIALNLTTNETYSQREEPPTTRSNPRDVGAEEDRETRNSTKRTISRNSTQLTRMLPTLRKSKTIRSSQKGEYNCFFSSRLLSRRHKILMNLRNRVAVRNRCIHDRKWQFSKVMFVPININQVTSGDRVSRTLYLHFQLYIHDILI